MAVVWHAPDTVTTPLAFLHEVEMTDIVWTDEKNALALYAAHEAPTALVDLLSRTEWGTSDVKYVIRGVPRILERIKEPHFLVLEKNGRAIGGVVGSRKRVTGAGRPYDAFYIAMIAIELPMAGSGYGTLLAAKAREYARGLIDAPGLIYLYVESTNTASVRVHEKVGYNRLGQFQTRIFMRLFPRCNCEVTPPNGVERAQLAALVEHQYASHALLDARGALADRKSTRLNSSH